MEEERSECPQIEDEFEYAFFRVETRKRRLKTRLDCGCMIDGTEPYRYMVYKYKGDPKGKIHQRTDCEFCARSDQAY